MSLRFWIVAIPGLIIVLGAFVIILDYYDRDAQESRIADGMHQHEHDQSGEGNREETDRDGSEEERALNEPDSASLARLLEIEEELEQTDNESLKIAYLGEMIHIYMENDRLDAAADAGYRLAELTGEYEDWKNAGDWFYNWLEEEPNDTRRAYFANRAAQAYQQALNAEPDNYELRTDKAAALNAAGKSDSAKQELRRAIEANPDYLEANYNLGVILHQTGSKEESISYLRRSAELAQGTEREAAVQEFINRRDISL